MNFSSIFGKIKSAINPQTAQEPVKPTPIEEKLEEFAVVSGTIREVPAVSAPEEKPEVAAQKSKSEKPAKPKGKPGRPRKIIPEPVKEKKEPELQKQPEEPITVKSPANHEQITKPNVISEVQPREINTIQELVESANGSISQSETNLITNDKRPENATPYHNENGKFAVGNPGGGRPKTARLTEAYKQILEIDGAETYARVIANIAVTGKKDSDRISAVQEITDRVEGKAVQNTNVRGVMVMVPAETVTNALDGWADD